MPMKPPRVRKVKRTNRQIIDRINQERNQERNHGEKLISISLTADELNDIRLICEAYLKAWFDGAEIPELPAGRVLDQLKRMQMEMAGVCGSSRSIQ